MADTGSRLAAAVPARQARQARGGKAAARARSGGGSRKGRGGGAARDARRTSSAESWSYKRRYMRRFFDRWCSARRHAATAESASPVQSHSNIRSPTQPLYPLLYAQFRCNNHPQHFPFTISPSASNNTLLAIPSSLPCLFPRSSACVARARHGQTPDPASGSRARREDHSAQQVHRRGSPAESATASQLNTGKVVAVGAGGRTRDGTVIPTAVKEGDTVLLPEYGGSQIKLDDKEYVLFRDDDILGILKD
ncbi:unnamed protein product [Closterium sp. Yama58-4]|nr:unnamed protein product [Closterium sp. Yama58-4]